MGKNKSLGPSKKTSKHESIRQKIFSAKTDAEKKMWENVLRKLEESPPHKVELFRIPGDKGTPKDNKSEPSSKKRLNVPQESTDPRDT